MSNNGFPFDVDRGHWKQVMSRLKQETDFSREEIERGLTFMLGRQASELLNEAADEENEEILTELEIAILHSNEEK